MNPRRFSLLWGLALAALAMTATACAPKLAFYDQVYNHLGQANYQAAYQAVQQNKQGYSEKNAVLYYLDDGITAHYAASYQNSIQSLTEAERRIDELYTESVSKQAASMLTNENILPYAGEDFENALTNLFMALDYAFMGKREDALVEARKVDVKLSTINNRYPPDKKNVYNEDAFIRLLMGLLYESHNEINDAYISYAKAEEAYQIYHKRYQTKPPTLLIQKLIASGQALGGFRDEVNRYKKRYPGISGPSMKETKANGEIFFLHYNGLSPRKVEDYWVVPLPDAYVAKIAFPKFERRPYRTARAELIVKNTATGKTYQARTEMGEDIGGIAIQNLDNRMLRIKAKAVGRAATKYAASKGAEALANKQGGSTAGLVAKLATNVYSVASEQADLRCWELLPDAIGIAYLQVPPGTYDLTANFLDANGNPLQSKNLSQITVKKGEKKFYPYRTIQ